MLIQRSDLSITSRQRSEIDPQHLTELKESIRSHGLLHPLVARLIPPRGYTLVAGETRLRALESLWETNEAIKHDGQILLPGEVPIVIADLEHASQWMAAEFEENAVRRELPWQDRVRAIDAIHRQRQLENPSQTVIDTARELNEKGISGATPDSKSVGSLHRDVKEAAVVAQHLDKYKIKTARNAHEAFSILMQDEEKKYLALLTKRRLAETHDKPIEVRHGDALTILPKLDNSLFDLILADPPYGIRANEGGFRTRGMHHHVYDDRPEVSRNLLQSILTEGFRITKPRANIFLFTDIQHFDWLCSAAAAGGWVPWRTPVIWAKSKSEGLAPWGRSGFRRTYEMLFFATKGQRGLIHSPCDILEARRVNRADRTHGAEKPVDLLLQLIECTTLIGESVLDPCCGVGSTLQAMRRLKRRGLGIEIDESYYNIALTRANNDDPEDNADGNGVESL